MVPRSAAPGDIHPDAVEFVRFCYHRRRVGWPELYDEMCAVAGRGLFHGLSADDLGGIGIGFSLFDMPALAGLASRIVAEEVALRRPVNVVIVEAGPDSTEMPTGVDRHGASRESAAAATPAATARVEHTFDVPIRLVLAPSGA